MQYKGAGGTEGGTIRFLVGLLMAIVGSYLFLDAVHLTNGFSFRQSAFGWGGFRMPGGYLLIPLMFGIGMIFYNSRNILGWFLAGASLAVIVFGVITSLDFHMRSMSLVEMLIILVLMVGGIGLLLSSLRRLPDER